MKIGAVAALLAVAGGLFGAAPAKADFPPMKADQFMPFTATEIEWFAAICGMELQYSKNAQIKQIAIKIMQDNQAVADRLSIFLVKSRPSRKIDDLVDRGKLDHMMREVVRIPADDFDNQFIWLVGSRLLGDSTIERNYAKWGDNPALEDVAEIAADGYYADWKPIYALQTGRQAP